MCVYMYVCMYVSLFTYLCMCACAYVQMYIIINHHARKINKVFVYERDHLESLKK